MHVEHGDLFDTRRRKRIKGEEQFLRETRETQLRGRVSEKVSDRSKKKLW